MAIPELQEEFAQYLTANYNYSHPRHMASEVFYSIGTTLASRLKKSFEVIHQWSTPKNC